MTVSPVEDEAWLRTALAARGLTLRTEDVAAALAAARFLAEAARSIHGAGR